MKLSKFGEKFSRQTAINRLMVDMSEAFASQHPDLCMLGGGNPAIIPDAQALFNQEMQHLMASDGFEKMLGLYSGPKGEQQFVQVLSDYLNQQFNWNIGPENIALTNGSQNSFFYLFNALAGEMPDASVKKILFPMTPEYVGYADAGLNDNMFCSMQPNIEKLDKRQFKYRIDFDKLQNKMQTDQSIAALCLSRPTNPTGNVITDHELAKLEQLAQQHNIPLIIDNAYGQPFPNVIFSDAKLPWSDNIILCLSLSKLGLPGARTGIIIAKQEVTQMISSLSGIITLAPNSIGAALMTRMIKDGEITHLTENIIKPFYQQKLAFAQQQFEAKLANLPIYMHKPEGAFFIWLWCENLPISSKELYERLKKRKVYIIPGEEFFIQSDDNWAHSKQCLRLNYAQAEDKIIRGFEVLAEELHKLY